MNARLAARGNQGPDLKEGNLDFTGCVSRRPSNLQPISFGAPKKRKIWSLDSKNAALQADVCSRDVLLRAPADWESKGANRI